tara:strand:- start:224 stop:442 length:219 start_codon:yes stop_codon:yes gene_type:complete
MKRFRVAYLDEWEMPDDAKEEDLYEKFLEYLADCVKNGDVTPFEFEEQTDWKAPSPHPCGTGYTEGHPNKTF